MSKTVPDHMRLHKFATAGVHPELPTIVHYQDWMLPLIKQFKVLGLGVSYSAKFNMSAQDLAVAYRAGLNGDWETYDNYVGLLELSKPEQIDYSELKEQLNHARW